jgi:hypothetical protein
VYACQLLQLLFLNKLNASWPMISVAPMLLLICCRLKKVADTGSVVLLHAEATKLTMDVIVKVSGLFIE